MEPTDKLRAMKRDTAVARIEYCRVMLDVHGFLSPSESLKVKKRILKWLTSKQEGKG